MLKVYFPKVKQVQQALTLFDTTLPKLVPFTLCVSGSWKFWRLLYLGKSKYVKTKRRRSHHRVSSNFLMYTLCQKLIITLVNNISTDSTLLGATDFGFLRPFSRLAGKNIQFLITSFVPLIVLKTTASIPRFQCKNQFEKRTTVIRKKGFSFRYLWPLIEWNQLKYPMHQNLCYTV